MDKIINSTCLCGEYLSKYNEELLMIEPCEHIIHFRCVHMVDNSCPFCNNDIKIILTFSEIKKMWQMTRYREYYQKYVDMCTIKYGGDQGDVDCLRLLSNIPHIILYTSSLMINDNSAKLKYIMSSMLNRCNIKLKVKGAKNISAKPMVIIANHTTYIDALVIASIFDCSFLVSSIVKNSWYGSKLAKLFPIIYIERSNKKKNTVQKIQKFINKKQKSVCLFPEGLVTHPKTLARFRSGAFRVGSPVLPVVIKYNPDVYSLDTPSYIFKLFSQKKIKVTVNILKPEYPPFDTNKIENIRNKMAASSNLALSRISNRDICDTTCRNISR